jgi:hypothetical protein
MCLGGLSFSNCVKLMFLQSIVSSALLLRAPSHSHPLPLPAAPAAKKGKKLSTKYKKAPDAPKRFKSAFIIFSAEKHKMIKKDLLEQGKNEKVRSVWSCQFWYARMTNLQSSLVGSDHGHCKACQRVLEVSAA